MPDAVFDDEAILSNLTTNLTEPTVREYSAIPAPSFHGCCGKHRQQVLISHVRTTVYFETGEENIHNLIE